VAVRFLLRRFAGGNGRNPSIAPGGMQYAGAGNMPGALPGRPGAVPVSTPGVTAFGSGAAGSTAAGTAGAGIIAAGGGLHLPADFDKAGFERIAKMIFIRMQAANDAGDLDDLRQFATPEMFAAFRLDLQDRKGTPQKTDVVQLDAEVLDVAEEAERQIVSVRFHGLIREEADAPTTTFDEVWHLVKPTDGSREWAIAGIGQNAQA